MATAAISRSCPSEAELSAFADGLLLEPDLSRIGEHIATCHSCEETLGRLGTESRLAMLLRLAKDADVVEEPECQRMQAAARAVPWQFDRRAEDPSEETTHSSRVSTEERPRKDEVRRDVETTIAVPAHPATIGRYRVQSLLGEGGYGRVYLAIDPDLDRQVAIKVPRFSTKIGMRVGGPLAAALLREARTAARLKHPGIVAVYDVGEDEEVGCFVAMEYVGGQSLKQRLKQGPVPHDLAVKMVAQAAEAVHYAHKQGLVHRDLKPANLLLDGDGNVKVADFGLAILEEEQRSRAGEFAGTRAYCSPEQVRGEVHRLDGRTDVWSLGVILYELLTGRRPFGGPHVEDEILHRPPKPPRQIDDSISKAVEAICLNCLQRETGNRFATARDLAAALDRCVPLLERKHWVRRRWIVAAATLGMTAMGAGFLIRMNRKASESVFSAPRRIAWQPYDIHDQYGYDKANRRYRFDAFGHAIFLVSEVDRTEVDISMNFGLKRWEGFGGICWNIAQLANGEWHCFAVRAGRYAAGRPFIVEVCENFIGLIGGGHQGVRSESIHLDFEADAPLGDRAALRIDADHAVVRQIWINDRALLDAPYSIPAREPNVQLPAGIGFGGQFGEVSVYGFHTQ